MKSISITSCHECAPFDNNASCVYLWYQQPPLTCNQDYRITSVSYECATLFPFCSPQDLLLQGQKPQTSWTLNKSVLTIAQLFWCQFARQDFVILTCLNEAEVQSSFQVLHLGRPIINKLITLGGQVPLHVTPPRCPPCEMTAQCLCTLFFLWLYEFPGKAFSYSFLSIVALFQQHPSHPYNVGKGPKTIISPWLRLAHWTGL